MKHQLFIGLLLMLPFGCAPAIYQVASVQSDQVKMSGRDFVFENDDVRLVYNLWEEYGRMRFLVFNKTNRPLYFDWSKSFLDRGTSVTKYNELSKSKLYTNSFDSHQYVYRNTVVYPYRLSARYARHARLPASEFVAIADLWIYGEPLNAPDIGQSLAYTQENSPIQLKHQLAYSFDKKLANPQLLEHSFWVDTLRSVHKDQLGQLYGSLMRGKPNAFYRNKRSGPPRRQKSHRWFRVPIRLGNTGIYL